MIGSLSLSKLALRIARTDTHLLRTLGVRIGAHSLANLVVEVKKGLDNEAVPEIIRPSIEEERLTVAATQAAKLHIDPNFAATLLYTIIGESCKVQTDFIHRHFTDHPINEKDPEAVRQYQRDQLLELTRMVAPDYDRLYAEDFFGTKLYLAFEKSEIARAIGSLDDSGLDLDLALDLGCATGNQALRLARSFKRVIGYDLCPYMIAEANKKLAASNPKAEVSFQQVDLEEALPLEANSVSLAVMSFGTASDIRDFDSLLQEIARVLKPGGKYILSFYNAQSLLAKLGFLPWPVSMAAMIDPDRHCLEVLFQERLFLIHARQYEIREVTELLAHKGLMADRVLTHPTLSPVIPEDILYTETFGSFKKVEDNKRAREANLDRPFNEKAGQALAQLDESLATSPLGLGAYILVIGGKPR